MGSEQLALLAASGLLLIISILAVRWVEGERLRTQLMTFTLRFPKDLSADAVVALFVGVSGIVPPRIVRVLVQRPIIIEITARLDRIEHRLLVPWPLIGVVLSQLSAALPDVVVREHHEDKTPQSSHQWLAAELGLSNHRRPLRADQPEAASASLLASLQPLGREEALVVQWILTPTGPVPAIRASGGQPDKRRDFLTEGVLATLRDADSTRAAKAKQEVALFQASVRLGVAAEPEKARLLMRRLLAPFHVVTAPGVHLYRRHLPNAWAVKRMQRRSLPLVSWPLTLNAKELAALTSFPIGGPRVAGIRLGGTRPLPATQDIPSSGRVIAQGNFPGQARPLALSLRDSLSHVWIDGPTGVGKSTLEGNLIIQDLEAGHSVVVIDPKGDLVADVLDRVPHHRIEDVILLDAADVDRPVGFNIFAGADQDPELAADQVLGTLHRLYRDHWGPRTQDLLHSGLLTLAQQPGATLIDLPLVFTNAQLRRRLVGRLDHPTLEGFWASFEAMSPAEQSQALSAPMNKLRQVTLRSRLRTILGQSEPTFTLEDVINGRKALFVSLPTGLLGEESAALVGSLTVARLWQAIQGRAALASDRRQPTFVHLDEVQLLANLPTDLGSVLAQSRGLGVGFHLAHQHLSQLPVDLQHAITANARSKILFQAPAGDAPALARLIGEPVRAEDLTALSAYEVVASLMAGGQVAPPVTGRTLPLPPLTGNAAAVRAASRARYGRDRAEVEAAIRARQERPRPEGPTLRRKRSGS